MEYFQNFTAWCDNAKAVTTAQIIVFDNVRMLVKSSSSFASMWQKFSAQQKNTFLENMVRLTDRNLDVLVKHDDSLGLPTDTFDID